MDPLLEVEEEEEDGFRVVDLEDLSASGGWSDYWTVLGENKSAAAAMVSESGRNSVLVFGALLVAWSLCLHVTLFWILSRRRGRGTAAGHRPLHWLLGSLSVGQVALVVVVIPIELVSEYRGAWTFGPELCRWWRPTHLALISLLFWGHFAVTVERYLRFVRVPVTNYDGTLTKRTERLWLTYLGVSMVWVVSFCCSLVVTLVMKTHDALMDDVCAVDMTLNTAFVLSFAVFFVPITLVGTASVALFFIRCHGTSAKVTFDHQSCTAKSARSNDAFGSTSTMGRCSTTPDRHYGVHALLISTVPDHETRELRQSAVVTMVANLLVACCWTPFYVTTLLIPFCTAAGPCVDPTLWTLFLWLGYSSVGLGPIVWFFEPSVRANAKLAIG